MEHKYHSGLKSGSRKSAGGVGTAVFILASIVLIAGIVILSPLGEYLMEHVIDPFLSCVRNTNDTIIVSALKQQEEQKPAETPSPKPTEKAHEMITIDEIPFYILQMGAFTAAEAAGQHADEINRIGAGGNVFQDGSIYRVFAAAYTDEASLMKVQSQVRADGFEATPYITESKGLKITLDGDSQAVDLVSDAVQLVNSIPSDLCMICLSFDKGDIKESDLIAELKSKQKECISSRDAMESIKAADVATIHDLLGNYAKNISTFLGEHDTMNTEMISGALKRLQLSIIIDYILFFDRK